MTLDPGLQPERTALAWRRTALSVAIGALVAARLLVPLNERVAVTVLVGGLVWSADLAWQGRRRYPAASAAVHHGGGAALTSAGVIARTAAAAVLAGAIGLAGLVWLAG